MFSPVKTKIRGHRRQNPRPLVFEPVENREEVEKKELLKEDWSHFRSCRRRVMVKNVEESKSCVDRSVGEAVDKGEKKGREAVFSAGKKELLGEAEG